MKLKDEFITYETDGEHVMVDSGTSFNGLVKSNKTAAFIIECLKNDTTEDEIIEKILERFDASNEAVSSDVKKIIETLRGINALND